MHMHESLHLVALDNHFNRDSPLLIVLLSILNPLTPTKCLEWKKQNGPIKYIFALSPFCFSLSSFSSQELDHRHHMSTFSMDFILLHHSDQTILSSHTLRCKDLSKQVSSIIQNQTRAFNRGLRKRLTKEIKDVTDEIQKNYCFHDHGHPGPRGICYKEDYTWCQLTNLRNYIRLKGVQTPQSRKNIDRDHIG